MASKYSYSDHRVRLDSALSLRVNDRLQRNGDPIIAVEHGGDEVSVTTRWETLTLPAHEPIYVWRETHGPKDPHA